MRLSGGRPPGICPAWTGAVLRFTWVFPGVYNYRQRMERNGRLRVPRRPVRKRPQRRRQASGWLMALKFAGFFVLLPVVFGAGIGGFLAFARGVPSIAELREEITPPSTKVYADDDALIGEFKIMKGRYVPLRRMPSELLNAVVAVEDSHFWSHGGIDYLAIVRAALTDIMKRHLKQGGSTITQQLAKMTFLTPEKTFTRKLKEFVLAQRIERNLTKEEILELYLNRAYFGHGAYGVEMAAQAYFGKPVREVTLPEAALIAGLLKAPSGYSPFKNFSRSRSRQGTVLKRMEDEKFISRKQNEEARETPIVLAKSAATEGANNYFLEYVNRYLVNKYGAETIYKGGLRVYTTLDRRAQAVAQLTVQKGLRDFDKRRGFRGPVDHIDLSGEDAAREEGFTIEPPAPGDILRGVVVTVDKAKAEIRTDSVEGVLSAKGAEWAALTLEPEAEEPKWIAGFNLRKILKPGDIIMVGVKSVKEGAAEFVLEQEPDVQGALVAIEPYSGYIRALVGGYDFAKSEFNRALYANRQVGSAFKPIIYALALNSGFTPASIIMDEEVTFDDAEEEEEAAGEETGEAADKEKRREERKKKEEAVGDGTGEEELEAWTPRNYDNEFHGATRLRDALAFSRNVVTVKLVDAIGINRVIKFARKVGIKSEMPRDLTISLGSMSITPLELTSSFSSFGNGGVKMEPIGIKYITDHRGKVVESNEPAGNRVMDPQTAFLTTSMMKDVVNYGTGWRARALRVPVAGKTGTTNDNRDAWFLGFTTDMVTGVWVGFDEPRPLGPEETGSRAAAPIWVDFMKSVTNRKSVGDFLPPEGIVTRLIDPSTGLLANTWTKNPKIEYFREGTEPKESAPSIWDESGHDNFAF